MLAEHLNRRLDAGDLDAAVARIAATTGNRILEALLGTR